MRVFLNLVVLIMAGYLLFAFYLYLSQRSMMYFPTPEARGTDAQLRLLRNADGQVRVWVVNEQQSPALIYFGGNAEAVEYNIPFFRKWFPGHAVYLVNYRGYGGSHGEPTEENLYRDALTVFDDVRLRHDEIAVLGRSLGSGVATWLAVQRSFDRLVLITPFDSLAEVGQSFYPLFPVKLLLKDQYDSASRAHDIRMPVLLLTAENDTIIPVRHSEQLASALDPQLVTSETIPGTDHNTISYSPGYVAALSKFLLARTATR